VTTDSSPTETTHSTQEMSALIKSESCPQLRFATKSARTGARRICFDLNFMNKLMYDEECSSH